MNYLLITIIIIILLIIHDNWSLIKEKFTPGNYQMQDIKDIPFTANPTTLFEDVITFPNDTKPFKKTGMQKCAEKCNGVCVEYGQSGIGYCFPKQ
jgi:hypothetical protein